MAITASGAYGLTLEKFLISVVHLRLRGLVSQDLAIRLMDKGNTRIAALQLRDRGWATR